jgi:uncharacterized protein
MEAEAPHPYRRALEARMEEALTDTPVLLIAGPRQAGKTTLVRQWGGPGRRYLTLDDPLTLQSARTDPVGLIRSLDHVTIDEIQRAPELLLAIKKSVDEDRRPGRFLLTGSANLMALPTVADSLAGRMETLLLLPLSQAEIEGASGNWLDQAFAGQILNARPPQNPTQELPLVQRVLRGGYPEAIARTTARRRQTWAKQYIDALIQRDVRDVAEVAKLAQLPGFLRALAVSAGQICNYTQWAGQVGMDAKTAARYVGVFEHMYLLRRIEPWNRRPLARLAKTPKLQFLDAGLLASIIGLAENEVARDRSRFGPVLETFVYAELLKHSSTANGNYQLLSYRDSEQVEVDVVAENAQGQIVGIEVKASATVRESDFKSLKKLAKLAGDDFTMGLVLYDGTEALPMGDKLWAAPLASLWGTLS